jgi:hypothetical protein
MNKKEQKAFKILVEAIEYMTMPLTSSIQNLTLERLIATMSEDEKCGKKALAKVKRMLNENR